MVFQDAKCSKEIRSLVPIMNSVVPIFVNGKVLNFVFRKARMYRKTTPKKQQQIFKTTFLYFVLHNSS